MAMKTFVNLPVKDLTKATEFFTKLGFSFDVQFTDENATRMIISDDTSVMLAVEPFFKGFITPQDITDTSRSREVIVGLSTESREQVDDLADKAFAAGGKAMGEPEDQHVRSFEATVIVVSAKGRCEEATRRCLLAFSNQRPGPGRPVRIHVLRAPLSTLNPSTRAQTLFRCGPSPDCVTLY